MKTKTKVLMVLVPLWVAVIFTLPSISRTYTIDNAQAKQVKYEDCGVNDICVAPWLQYDEDTIEGYIKMIMTKQGLKDEIDLALRIVDCESKFKPDAVGVNTNGSFDRGVFMINNYWHKEVSNACAFNYKCNINEAIRIRLESGNWEQWVCYFKVK